MSPHHLILVATTLLLLTPQIHTYYGCGRCLLKGDICLNTDSCLVGLKCTSQLAGSGGAPVCIEQFDRHAPCNDTQNYDPCPAGFYCDRTTSGKCELNSNNKNQALKNDGCFNSDYCVTGLTCKDSVCVSSQVNGACQTTADCNWNEFCSGQQCKSFPASGETCSGICQFMTTCSNGKCVDLFSIDNQGACDVTEVCKAGFICKDSKCQAPTYDILLGNGVAWGADCHPGETGCFCNNGLHNFQFIREYSQTYNGDCQSRMSTFQKCMTDNSCVSQLNFNYPDTCLRRKCYWQYVSYNDYCRGDPSLVGSRCGGAGALYVFTILIVGLLLSF